MGVFGKGNNFEYSKLNTVSTLVHLHTFILDYWVSSSNDCIRKEIFRDISPDGWPKGGGIWVQGMGGVLTRGIDFKNSEFSIGVFFWSMDYHLEEIIPQGFRVRVGHLDFFLDLEFYFFFLSFVWIYLY